MRPSPLAAVALLLLAPLTPAQTDTAFTYQGVLKDAGGPASGSYNIDVTLWDAQSGGLQLGPPIMFNAVPIADGQFTLDLDFADLMLSPADKWIELSINGTELAPRQRIVATPYAIRTRGINVDTGGNVGIGADQPEHELDVRSPHPVLRLTATDALVTSYPALAFKSGPGPSLFQSLGRIDFYDQDDTLRALVSANKAGATNASLNLSTTPTQTPQLSVFSTSARIAGALEFQRRADLSITGKLNTDGANSYLNLDGSFLGIGTSSPFAALHVAGRVRAERDGLAIWAISTPTGLSDSAILGETRSTFQFSSGVRGLATESSGFVLGVQGDSESVEGAGVFGRALSNSGVNYGVYGVSLSSSGYDFYAGGFGVDYGSSSSRRWKLNVTPIADPLGKLSKIRGVTFDWDAEHGGRHDVGMIAEEVGAVLPEVVQYEPNGIDAIGMDYSRVSALLVEATKALRAEVESLHDENQRLRERLDAIESLLVTTPHAVASDR